MEKCTFLLCNRKVPKECTQAVANLRFAPLGDPPTPVGMREGDVPTLAEVCIRRKDAFREAHCVRAHTRREVHCN